MNFHFTASFPGTGSRAAWHCQQDLKCVAGCPAQVKLRSRRRPTCVRAKEEDADEGPKEKAFNQLSVTIK